MPSAETVIESLKQAADPEKRAGMARYGISVEERLGVSVPDIRRIAKEIGQDHRLALSLWGTGISEAMILASMIADPDQLTGAEMDRWVTDLDSWDVCDQACMNLFDKSPMAWEKVVAWSQREEEFVKRAGYALLACLAWHDKEVADERFLGLIPMIERGATDPRNYVKKAVSWALRNIGKRDEHLHGVALETAEKLSESDSKPARWIASQTIRDLSSDATARRLNKQKG